MILCGICGCDSIEFFGFSSLPTSFDLTGRAEAMRYLEHALRHIPEGHSGGDTEIRASSFRTGAGLVAHC